ncbi:MAG: radical SAM protein [Deltaproteobacteria bacterium RIFCSPLOWO2_12_FULL_60_19]|nr:MAG: radical SAM protein [Deltaproteobacteria bacterium RIFCSPLOWO2_12_FULL_60_19]
MKTPSPLRGRGSASNPKNRFESLERVSEPMHADEVSSPATQFLPDHSKSLIAYNDSPDVGFDASINPYRGCEHGCVYCYARPTHEYLGFSAGLDFETKIMVKGDAPQLLRKELSSPKWKPRVLAMSGVTDCYQPVEKKLELTRRCLEVLLEFRNPVTIVSKNYLVTRDIDILSELARHQCAAVFVSLTTLDEKLSGLMEPRASRPVRRLAAIEALARASIPVGFLLAPMIPGLTDSEAPAIAQAAAGAGARFAGYVALRLPHGVKELFENWLEQHYPGKKDKILNRLRAVRSGKLNDPRFHSRMKGEGIFAEQMAELFRVACKKTGIHERAPRLSTEQFRRPTEQLSLFNHSAA